MLVRECVASVEKRGRQRVYALRDPAWVRRLLATFTPLPEAQEPFDRIWDDLTR